MFTLYIITFINYFLPFYFPKYVQCQQRPTVSQGLVQIRLSMRLPSWTVYRSSFTWLVSFFSPVPPTRTYVHCWVTLGMKQILGQGMWGRDVRTPTRTQEQSGMCVPIKVLGQFSETSVLLETWGHTACQSQICI